nr:hypothetical protein [Chlamydiota bacterium]
LQEEIKELKEKVLPTNERLNLLENAATIMEMAENPAFQPDDIVEYLINDQGPYSKNPDRAEKCLIRAMDETKQQIKNLKPKRDKQPEDYKIAESKLQKLQIAYKSYLNQVKIDINAPYTGISMGRVIRYKKANSEKIKKLIPRFQNETEFIKAIKELRSQTDSTAHSQWCSQYNYPQVLALFSHVSRETSELLNSKGSDIEPGELIDSTKCVKNNTSYKFVFRIFKYNKIVAIKEWFKKIGRLKRLSDRE